MSMDLAVWSKGPIPLPQSLPQRDWVSSGPGFALETDEWQILVMHGDDQAPEEVLSALADAASPVFVTLEPIGAPAEAYEELEAIVRHLAKVSGGVWVDANGEAYSHDAGSF